MHETLDMRPVFADGAAWARKVGLCVHVDQAAHVGNRLDQQACGLSLCVTIVLLDGNCDFSLHSLLTSC